MLEQNKDVDNNSKTSQGDSLLTKPEVDHILHGHPVNQSKVSVQYKSEGPAAFEPWLGLVDNDPNPWLHTEQASHVNGAKEKIIICEPMEGFRPMNPFVYVFIDHLIKYYEVYFWNGPEGQMRLQAPLPSSAAFWKEKRDARIGTEAEVRQSLADEGLRPQDYIILDFHGFADILKRNINPLKLDKERFFLERTEQTWLAAQGEDTLDLRRLSRPWVECLRGMDPSKIKKLIIYPETDLNLLQLLRAFPHAHSIEVNRPSAYWVQNSLHLLDGKSVTLNLEHLSGTLIFFREVRLEALTINYLTYQGKDKPVKYFMGRLFQPKKITIYSQAPVVLDLKQNVATEELSLNALTVELLTAKSSPLKKLSTCHFRRESKIPFSKLNNLEELRFDYVYDDVRLPFGVSGLTAFLACFCAKEVADTHLPALKKLTLGAVSGSNNVRTLDFRYRELPVEVYSRLSTIGEWRVLSQPGRPLLPITPISNEQEREAYFQYESRVFFPQGGFYFGWGAGRYQYDDGLIFAGLAEIYGSDLAPVSADSTQLFELSKNIYVYPSAPKHYPIYHEVLPPNVLSFALSTAGAISGDEYCFSPVIKSNLTRLRLIVPTFKSVVIDFANLPNLIELEVDAGKNDLVLKNLADSTKLRIVKLTAASELIAVPWLVKNAWVHITKTEKKHYQADSNTFKCPTIKTPAQCMHDHPRLKEAFVISMMGVGGAVTLGVLAMMVFFVYEAISDAISYTPTPSPAPPTTMPPAPPTVVTSHENHDMYYVYGAAGLATLGLLCLLFFNRDRLGALLRGLAQPVAYDDDFDVEAGLSADEAKHAAYYDCYGHPDTMLKPDRLRVKSSIKLSRGNIIFYAKEKDLERVDVLPVEFEGEGKEGFLAACDACQDNSDLATYCFEGNLKAGRYYPLPVRRAVLHKEDVLQVFAKPTKGLEIYFSEENQAPYLRLKRGKARVEVYVQVRHPSFEPGLFDLASRKAVLSVANRRLLSRELSDFIATMIDNYPDLSFINSQQQSSFEKLKQLSDLLKGVQSTQVKRSKNFHLPQAMQALHKKSLHPVDAYRLFVLFAQYLSIPATLVTNHSHLYAELPYDTAKGRCLSTHYLGDNALVLNQARKMNDEARATPSLPSRLASLWGGPTQKELAEEARRKELKADYRKKLSAMVTRKPFRGAVDLIQAEYSTLTPLLVLDPAVNGFDFHQALIEQVQPGASYYVNSLRDLNLAFKTNRIDNGVLLKKQPGLLAKLLKQQHDFFFLIFNLDGFSGEALAKIHACFDDRKLMLEGETIALPAFVQVICVTHAPEKLDEAFLSRMRLFDVHKRWTESLSPVVRGDCVEVVDLFELPAWRERVFGEINFRDGRLQVESGPLIKAIHENKTLVLQNVPEDASLQLLIHQVNVERRVLINGDILRVPEGCYVVTETKPHAVSMDAIHWLSPSEIEASHCVDVGLHNFYEATVKQLLPNEQGRTTTFGPLLQHFNPERGVIRIVSVLPRPYFDYLIHYLEEHHPGSQLMLSLAPNVYIEGLDLPFVQPLNPQPLSEQTAGLSLFASTDPQWLADRLAASMDNPDIIHIHPQTTVQDLLVSVVLTDNNEASFSSRPQGLLKAIEAKTPVILIGEPSVALFHHLETLFQADPYLDYQGKRMPLIAPMKLIFPSHRRADYPRCDAEFNPTWEDYQRALSAHPAYTPERFEGIKNAVAAIAKYPHGGRGRPAPFTPHYDWLKNLLLALGDPQPQHRENKLKAWLSYHYPRHLEIQAYVNVVLKYYVGSTWDDENAEARLSQRLSRYDLNNRNAFRDSQWRVLATFSKAFIATLIGDDWFAAVNFSGTPSLLPDKLQVLQESAKDERQHSAAPSLFKQPNYKFQKQNQQLQAFVSHPVKRVAFVKGSPGVSKTHSIKQLKLNPDILFCEGEAALFAALAAKNTDKLMICLIDEANMHEPGTLDYLIAPIGRSEPKITLPSGQSYPLPPNVKLLLSGNPEAFINRHYHPAIIDYAEIIYFDDPDDDALMSLIAKEGMPPIEQALMRQLIAAFRAVKDYHPHFTGSIRDVLSLKHRYDLLMAGLPKGGLPFMQEAALQACEGEFAASIPDCLKRKRYLEYVEECFDLKGGLRSVSEKMIRLTDDVYLPREKNYLVEALLQALTLRLQYLIAKETSEASAHLLKSLVVLQGASGLGKSTVQRAVVDLFYRKMEARLAVLYQEGAALHRAEIKVLARELEKQPVYFSLSDVNAAKTLKKAYQEECIVISDEVNVDPAIEKIMIELLESGSNAFLFLGSQNGTGYRDRMEASPALVNRQQVLYFDDYTGSELEAIAEHFGVEEPSLLVEAYLSLQQNASFANTRTFYTLLKTLRAGELRELAKPQQDDSLSEEGERSQLLRYRRG